MKKKNQNNLQSGLSLIELLLSLSIVAIFVTFGVLGYNAFFEQNNVSQITNKLYTLLNSARSYSLKEHVPVIVCSSIDHVNCQDSRWGYDIIAFVDYNRDKKLDGNDQLLEILPLYSSQVKVTFYGFPSSQYIQFSSDNLLSNSSGTLTFCANLGDRLASRGLIINQTGIIRFAEDSNFDGVYESNGGKPLSCV